MSRPLPPLAACAAIYGVSIAALLASHLGHGWGFVDLTVYRYGGEAVLHGAHLYDLRFPGALAFTYPPLSALLFTGLTLPAPELLRPLLTGASLLLLPLMLGFALRLRPLDASLTRERAIRLALLASALAVWLEPVWTTLRYGQVDLVIGALILYDLSRPDSSRFKGAGIGLAVALKLTPAIFALYLLLSRRVRAAAVCAGVFLASVALGFALIPGDSQAYWGGAFLDSGRVGRIENAANQSLRGAFARLAHSTDVRTVWLCAAVVLALAGLALAARAGRRGDDVEGVSLCALTGLLVSPISWSHHWVLAVPALMLLAVRARRRRSPVVLAAAVAVAIVALVHMIWWVPVNRPRHSELHLNVLQLVYADAYVLIAIVALAAAGVSALRGRRSRSHARGPAPAGHAWQAASVRAS
ncbi:MAG TPA: glycosyltransferase 87 family protein [Solirubrobacteraceae bacterium]|nr:glycosyltransferase 87 family protein [Solirubrobacteraceae bacterium]